MPHVSRELEAAIVGRAAASGEAALDGAARLTWIGIAANAEEDRTIPVDTSPSREKRNGELKEIRNEAEYEGHENLRKRRMARAVSHS